MDYGAVLPLHLKPVGAHHAVGGHIKRALYAAVGIGHLAAVAGHLLAVGVAECHGHALALARAAVLLVGPVNNAAVFQLFAWAVDGQVGKQAGVFSHVGVCIAAIDLEFRRKFVVALNCAKGQPTAAIAFLRFVQMQHAAAVGGANCALFAAHLHSFYWRSGLQVGGYKGIAVFAVAVELHHRYVVHAQQRPLQPFAPNAFAVLLKFRGNHIHSVGQRRQLHRHCVGEGHRAAVAAVTGAAHQFQGFKFQTVIVVAFCLFFGHAIHVQLEVLEVVELHFHFHCVGWSQLIVIAYVEFLRFELRYTVFNAVDVARIGKTAGIFLQGLIDGGGVDAAILEQRQRAEFRSLVAAPKFHDLLVVGIQQPSRHAWRRACLIGFYEPVLQFACQLLAAGRLHALHQHKVEQGGAVEPCVGSVVGYQRAKLLQRVAFESGPVGHRLLNQAVGGRKQLLAAPLAVVGRACTLHTLGSRTVHLAVAFKHSCLKVAQHRPVFGPPLLALHRVEAAHDARYVVR